CNELFIIISSFINTFKNILGYIFYLVVGIYVGIIILLNAPYVQQKVIVTITEKLGKVIDAELNAGGDSCGFLVRDGFKPVHRRILYGMMELGNTSDKGVRFIYPMCEMVITISSSA
ncbi:DNA gyrase subunit A, partial [termite gut metagenome]